MALLLQKAVLITQVLDSIVASEVVLQKVVEDRKLLLARLYPFSQTVMPLRGIAKQCDSYPWGAVSSQADDVLMYPTALKEI